MSAEAEQQEMLIVTGMSGAGRSTVGNALEDLGWYVVDNLPRRRCCDRSCRARRARAGNTLPRIAAVIDVRGGKPLRGCAADHRGPSRQRRRCGCCFLMRRMTTLVQELRVRCVGHIHCRAMAHCSTESPRSEHGWTEIRESSDHHHRYELNSTFTSWRRAIAEQVTRKSTPRGSESPS